MSNKSNYGTLIMSSLRDFQDTFPEMTFGEILYSFLRDKTLDENIDIQELVKIRKIPDERIYQAIENSLKEEQDEPIQES